MTNDPVLLAEQQYDAKCSDFERRWEMYESSSQYLQDLNDEFAKLVCNPDSFWEAWGYDGFYSYTPQHLLEKTEADLMNAVIDLDYEFLGRFIAAQFTHYFQATAEDNLRDNHDFTTH